LVLIPKIFEGDFGSVSVFFRFDVMW